MADVRFNATLPERQHDWLRQRAFAERRSMAEVLRDVIDGAMSPEEGTSVRIVIVEAGTDYTERLDAFEAKLAGAEAEQIEQAAALVAERGHRVLTNAEGGCCEYVSTSDGDYIAISVAPAPNADEQAVNYFRSLAAQGRATGNFAGLEELRHQIGDDTYRVHIDTHAWTMTVYRHSAGADGKPTEPGVEVETVSL